ncbi:hypothetical protein N0O92_01755 [Alkalihalobacillus sp. MEB130]|uniref:hypothetical protein n=1 Tax=Alkalihalobacillus sp. MEB130 TaxID=2976704 RepID=UPI0028E05E18|nr:hypothetical protein [Alkalihalobacillus sp. MEB130]MDT8858937.1 hypothetical protein [Alkalihalobacillus sp. MEB130]
MDKQILDLLKEMSKEMKSMKLDMTDLKSEMKNMKSDVYDLKLDMHNRFDTIEAKLEGVGGQFELMNESRIIDVDFIADKVNKMEKELYILKNKNNN